MDLRPRLIAVSGPLEGRTFSLSSEGFVIGRQADSQLQVLELSVSRRHCELRPDSEQRWVLSDLGSSSGTLVNSRPINERTLEHGDLVQVGTSRFVFLLYESMEEQAAPAAPDMDWVVRSTQVKRLEESAYLQRVKVPAGEEESRRAAEDLSALLRLCTAVQAARELEAVAAATIDGLLASVPAERGCMLLVREDAEEMRVAAPRTRGSESPSAFPVSRTVLARTVAERVALLYTDLEADTSLKGAESLQAARVRSLLCAPLIGRERVLGALYLDSSQAQPLTERHLELVIAAAAVAALAVENASYIEWLRTENQRLQAQGPAHDMVGDSPAMKRLYALIQRVGPTHSTVLLRGESGTGKELCARAIHATSPRVEGPFVAINCATLTETLLESELFGHEKGAFTGAVARKPGKIELAHKGTLFLDEIGELPLGLQAKLLRVLQEREFDRVGGTRPIPVDVRIIAATHRDLDAAIRERRFREDLFYRLNVVTLHLPALRERRADIPLLAQYFARVYSERVGRQVVGLSEEAREALLAYDWPGNVRQLGNAIERALVLGTDELIRREDLPDEVLAARVPAPDSAEVGTFEDRILATKRKLIVEAYEQASGDHQSAARLLGIHPNSLHRLVRTLQLRAELGK
ncbi:MAG TPA: sigma 54-interacting transcriptional regulator [Hyalangium sp.]|nr:sigma 54-interacting transcriptional regulator [Hyalangium sp.]